MIKEMGQIDLASTRWHLVQHLMSRIFHEALIIFSFSGEFIYEDQEGASDLEKLQYSRKLS